jgi:hypothetical protein
VLPNVNTSTNWRADFSSGKEEEPPRTLSGTQGDDDASGAWQLKVYEDLRGYSSQDKAR